jgi:starch-binding outer membrane protein, SusD/RagB family
MIMMKITIYKISLVLSILGVMISCNDVLQIEEQTAIDGDRIFNDPDLAQLYLNYIYGQVMPGFAATSNVGKTDESVAGGGLISGTELDPTTAAPDATPGNYSKATFAKLRNVNLFLTEIEKGSIDQNRKNSFKGQAYFLRAWIHWDLVKMYGGIPLVLMPLDNNDNIDDALPRLSASVCVAQIVSDLDQSILLINGLTAADNGRITRSAAAAFKGRVLLHFASPQFDPNGMTNADGIASRWQTAYQANVEAKAIALEEGHGLHPDFSQIFLKEDNAEGIMIRKFSVGLQTHGYENSVRPSSVDNSGDPASTPSWNLVSAFPMKDGKSIVGHPSYDENVYWKDRDPRFYATIGYNSIPWKFKDRADSRQWTYLKNKQESNIIPQNGFYVKKNINTEITNTQTVNTPTDWLEIRYAEVLLNLAECANEVGKPAEAYTELAAIRARAGIEAGTGTYGIASGLSKVELRGIILNERLIEFAYEDKRYWDLRRRNLYENGIDGVPRNGFNGKKRQRITTAVNTDFILSDIPGIWVATNPTDSAFKHFEAYLLGSVDWSDPTNYSKYFITTIQDAENASINYLQPKYNFFYLPINEITNNKNAKQTLGWLDGTFNPLVD